MEHIMIALGRISKAIDAKNIGEVLLALQDLDDNIDLGKCEDSFSAFLNEIITWDLTESPNISESVVRHFMSLLRTKETIKRICERIVMAQTSVAVQIAVEMMIAENWNLSQDDCREVCKRIEARKATDEVNEHAIDEYLSRASANCTILRLSGTPSKLLSQIVSSALRASNGIKHDIPKHFLNEIAIVAPFHPLAVIEDQKNHPDCFLIPRVNSTEFRFRLEVKEFVEFLQSPSSYQKEHARSTLEVFRSICGLMDVIEQMESEEIEKIVDFWLTAICIFDGYGIGLDDITAAAKCIERTTSRFVLKRQPLFLKRFLRKLHDKKDATIGLEPQIVATVITTFQRAAFNNRSLEYYEELGEFWTLCMKMKYDDVYYSTVFYSSVFALAQAQAVFRVKKDLCREVYETILKPMHQQIVDFVKMKKVESNKEMSEEERMIMEQTNIGSSYFSILACTYNNAEERILQFINQ